MWNKDGDKVVRWMYQQKTVDLSVIDDDKRLKLEDFQIWNFSSMSWISINLKKKSITCLD